MDNYYALSRSSIKQACDLVNSGTLELNANLCKYLGEALIETDEFLHQRFGELSELHDFCDKRRVALLQLYSVVKQAETLVLKCCESQSPAWPKRALAVLGIKEDILDIVLHLRWWESILEIAIASTGSVLSSQMSEIECLKSANQKFESSLETLTSSSNELQQAAALDKELLVQKIDKLRESYAGEPGTREHYDYLISIQVRSLLTDEEVGWTPELNDYKYLGALGEGGFGVVLHVEWCGNDCALKIFDKVRHLRNEAKSLNKCRHPHIVQCFRYWEQSQQSDANTSVQSHVQSHLLMERMPTDLAKHILSMKEGEVSSSRKSEVLTENPGQTPILPFSNPVAVDVMLQLSKAMWHMHSKGDIHRDLKPGNVLMRRVSEDEVPELFHEGFLHVKLADFGLARGDMMSSNDDTLTYNAGSTLYRAPELSLGQYVTGHNYPRKADVWSFGIMSAEILSGLRPFPHNVLMVELKASIKSGLRPHLPDDCPDYLKVCLENCWKYEPTERPRFSEIWKMLRFAKLRSLGIIEQNYDLFIFEAYRDHIVELDQPPQQKPPVCLPQPPGPQPQLPVPKPQRPASSSRIPLSQLQPSIPLKPFVKKVVRFFTSIPVKLGKFYESTFFLFPNL